MAAIWKPQDAKVYQDWIDTILDEAEGELNDWERNFIEDIQISLNRKGKLTQAQAEKLEQIYASKTS
jgi:thiaminase